MQFTKPFGILALLCLLIPAVHAFGQQPVTYSYDANGNRIKRYVLLKSGALANESDSISIKQQPPCEEKLGELTIYIYPNPVRGELNIQINSPDEPGVVEYILYSQTGTLIEKKKKPVTR